MHKNSVVPLTYHQYVKYLLQGGQGTISADNDPFPNVKAYHVEAQFYKVNGKELARDEGSSIVAFSYAKGFSYARGRSLQAPHGIR